MIYQSFIKNQTKTLHVKKKSPDTCHQKTLVKRVENLIITHRLFLQNDTVIVAVSGGPDSIALLHLLSRINVHARLIAVYVNHGLRPEEIGAEIHLIESLCSSLNIPFEKPGVDVHGERERTGASLEEAARTLRYTALETIRRNHGGTAIAVAHTADDQAEEFLIRLIRGTGRKGLSGMALRRNTIIRPLLQEKKQILINYLNENALPFCLDSSNQERICLRNKVRLDFLPYLEQNFNSSIRRNLVQTMEILNSEEELLDRLTEDVLKDLVEVDESRISGTGPCPEAIRINTRSFLDCHQALQRRILEKVCWMMLTRPGFRQIEQIRHLIMDCSNGAETHLGLGLRIWKTGKEIRFSHPVGRKGFRGNGLENTAFSLAIEGPGLFPIAGHVLSVTLQSERPDILHDNELLLDAEQITFPLLLRPPLPGERFRPLGAVGRKKINRFLNEAKIPRKDRRFSPVLVSTGRIIAVAGLRIDHDFRVQDDTRCFLRIDWRKS
jgi:tRNA(Ile)-lysidine synthase